MRELYPEIEPFDEGFLKVSELHSVHYEQVGNPRGKKAIFFHGGPGGGLDPDYRRYFDPKSWHVTLFDQSGSGKSTQNEELRENSQLLVITHQKRTMEVGDALYGVTMRGDGVSTVISQRLREAEAS